ncbi:MAG: hypothetical protein RPT00_00835, partial [Gammaproteobacteria bacterium]
AAGPLKRPIPMLSFALNYFFSGGYTVSAFKITNIFIHCINAALIFILCLQLYKRATSNLGTPPHYKTLFWLASSISLLWATHPINLTSVLYIVQRMTSLSTLFSLSCVILYLAARNRCLHKQLSWRTTGLFFASTTSLVLALFSKENAALIPLIILLIEWILYSNERPWRHFNNLSKQKQRVIWSAIIILCFFALLSAIDYASDGFNSRPFTMLERVLTESRVLCFYISLILIPRINGFGLFHDDIALSTSLFAPWTTITSIIFIVSLLAIAFYYRKKTPLFSLGIGWFFIGHLLESTFFPLEISHEHRNNLPSIGIILAAVSLIAPSKLHNKKVVYGLVFVTLILGSTTWLRAKQWANYQSLAYYEAEHHPNSPATQALLSNAANQAGDINVATQAIKKAMELKPNETAYAMHYQNILAIYGKTIPAELQRETLRRITTNHLTASTHLALNQIASCLKKEPCAPLKENYLEWIDAVLEKTPTNATYWYMRGKAHRAINNDLNALNDFQRAFNLNDKFLHPLFEMVDILLLRRQIPLAEEVIILLEKANERTTFRRDVELNKLKVLLAEIKKSRSSSR